MESSLWFHQRLDLRVLPVPPAASGRRHCWQQQLERQERVIVGVNRYTDEGESSPIPTLKIEPEIERDQIERITAFRAARSETAVKEQLARVRQVAVDGTNLMPILIDAVDSGVTLGEVSDLFREVFGVYTDPGLI